MALVPDPQRPLAESAPDPSERLDPLVARSLEASPALRAERAASPLAAGTWLMRIEGDPAAGGDADAVNDHSEAVIEAHRIEQRRQALRSRAMARAPFEQIRAVAEIAILEQGLGERLVLFEAAHGLEDPPHATIARIPPTLVWYLDEGESPEARLDRLVAFATRSSRLAELADELGLFEDEEPVATDWERGRRLGELLEVSTWRALDELRLADEAGADWEEGASGAAGPPVPPDAIGVFLEIDALPFGDAAEVVTRIATTMETLHRQEQRRRAEDAVAFFETRLAGDPGPLEPGFDEKRREAILRDRLEHARGILERLRSGSGERVRVLRHPDELIEG